MTDRYSYSPVNLGILEAQDQSNCNIIVFNVILVMVTYLATY